MFCDDGDVIFYYKSSPNWIRPGSTYYEFMIVYDDDDECHKIKEFNKYVNDSLEIFDREPKGKIGCTFEAILTIDEFRQIGEILEKHKELITVNTEIYNHVCDGSNEEFYFQALSFNRSCSGNIILHTGKWFVERDKDEDKIFFDSETDKFKYNRMMDNAKQSSFVYMAVKELFDYLKSINKFPSDNK